MVSISFCNCILDSPIFLQSHQEEDPCECSGDYGHNSCGDPRVLFDSTGPNIRRNSPKHLPGRYSGAMCIESSQFATQNLNTLKSEDNHA